MKAASLPTLRNDWDKESPALHKLQQRFPKGRNPFALSLFYEHKNNAHSQNK